MSKLPEANRREAKAQFRDVFEPTQTIGDVRLGRDTFEAVCNASSVMPRPMSRNEAIKRLVLTDTLDQRMSGCLVVATLYIERQPGLEDQRGQDRRPGLEEVNERLVGGLTSSVGNLPWK